MKVGPTERFDLLSGAGVVAGAVPAVVASGAGAAAAGAAAVAPAGAAPFLAVAGAAFADGARDIFFALSSVTMMSPCCSAEALSSMVFKASDQVCPAALQSQD